MRLKQLTALYESRRVVKRRRSYRIARNGEMFFVVVSGHLVYIVVVAGWRSDDLDVVVEEPKSRSISVGDNVRFYCRTVTAPVSPLKFI